MFTEEIIDEYFQQPKQESWELKLVQPTQ